MKRVAASQARFQLFAPLRTEEYDALKADIAKRGILVPVEVDEDTGEILDGHHRLRIAQELEIEAPKVLRRFASEDDRVEHVLKINLLRRHLGPVSWAEGFRKLAEVRGVELGTEGGRPKADGNRATVAQLAEEVGVPLRTSQHRLKVAAELASRPDLADKVDTGQTSARRALSEKRRDERRQQNAAKPTPKPATDLGTFEVLYADPPWRYDDAEPSRDLDNQYPTMTLDAIKALKVPAGRDAILFLWATSPKLREALDVMEAWGFTYRTNLVWVKDKIGMGYYARQRHELLLVGKRGDHPTPDPENRPDSVLEAPRVKHSAKPDRAYETIERMYPNASRVELFARSRRDGWTSWGNET